MNFLKIHLFMYFVQPDQKWPFQDRAAHIQQNCVLFFFTCFFLPAFDQGSTKSSPAEKEKLQFPFIFFSFSSQRSITTLFLFVFVFSLCNHQHTLTSGHCSLEVVTLWPLESK